MSSGSTGKNVLETECWVCQLRFGRQPREWGAWEMGRERLRGGVRGTMKTVGVEVSPDPVGTWSHLANWQLKAYAHGVLTEGL